MKKKLFATELENVILYKKQQLSEYSKEVINDLKKAGHIFIPVTTINPEVVFKKIFKDVELPHGVICYTGTKIKLERNQDYFNKKVSWKNCPMEFDKIKDLIMEFSLHLDCSRMIMNGKEIGVVEWKKYSNEVFQVSFIFNKKIDSIISKIEKKYSNEFMIRHWKNDDLTFITFNAAKSDKLSAIKKMIEFYNIDEENVYFFGGTVSDIKSLKYFKNSIVTSNIPNEIKKSGKISLDFSNEDDAVAKYIKSLIS